MTEVKPFSISRIFNAPLALVYQVNTEVEHMIHWHGPAGAKVIRFDLNFKVGGVNHYGLEFPDGNQMWGKQTYLEIVPLQKIVLLQSFSDKEGNITRHPLADTWPLEMHATTRFESEGEKTKMTITWYPYHSDEIAIATFDNAREGMTGGFSGMFETLENYLQKLV
jgi:uncharacterized protein YndB with AHSA1/START domain